MAGRKFNVAYYILEIHILVLNNSEIETVKNVFIHDHHQYIFYVKFWGC